MFGGGTPLCVSIIMAVVVPSLGRFHVCSQYWLASSIIPEDTATPGPSVPLQHFYDEPSILLHDCNSRLSLYMGKKLLLTQEDFERSIIPLSIPASFEASPAIVTSAVFDHSHIVMVVNEKVYIYHMETKSWRKAKGIPSTATDVSNYQCCFSDDPICQEMSSYVIAYSKGVRANRSIIYSSHDGGFHFKPLKLTARIQSIPGIVEGVYNFPSISQIGLLVRYPEKGVAKFEFIASTISLISLDFALNSSDPITVVQPPGMRGFTVITNKKSLLFSFNHGDIVQTLAVSDTEIAVLSRNMGLFYGNLNMDVTIVHLFKENIFTSLSVPKFSSQGILTIITPVEEIGFFTFQKCSILIMENLMKVLPPLMACPVQILDGEFHQKIYYIDMKKSLNFSVEFVPKPSIGAIPLVVVSDPHILAFQATLLEKGYTYGGNTKYVLDLYLMQQYFSGMADQQFCHSLLHGRLSSLTVDIINKGVFCIDMQPLTALIKVGCPPNKRIKIVRGCCISHFTTMSNPKVHFPAWSVPRTATTCSRGVFDQALLQNDFQYTIQKDSYDPKLQFRRGVATEDLIVSYNFKELGCPLLIYYDTPWLPTIELWEGDTFVEIIPVEFVMFEIHGIYNYYYQLTPSDAGCVSEPQSWTSMISQQEVPDPNTAWNRKNYRSCKTSTGPVLNSDSYQYEVLGGGIKNMILFPKSNGIYTFKVIVVDPLYSYCDLTTTFSVYVYGVVAESSVFDGMLSSFIAGVFLSVALGFLMPHFFSHPSPRAEQTSP
ncbi:cation channel sperm-associated auxiliary subunit delta isoform X4 [Ascaphus truei]|uniref:cation channel sperm-associated auxiliary subunit delta isoform X4 n=1 Tax=Ascaphus truei TaxID=8439 RepID=UPI003F5A7DCE